MKPEDVISTYENVGRQWAKQRYAGLMEKQWLDRFRNLAPRSTGSVRVVDIGCGSGRPIASYLTERGVTVTGVDATDTMTRLFAENLPQAQVIKADMRGLTLDQTFDGILAWDSFFHLSVADQRPMFATFARLAAPGAALMFTSGHLAGEAIGQVADAPIYHASLDPEDYRALLEDNGFAVIRYTPEDADCGGHTVWLAQFTA